MKIWPANPKWKRSQQEVVGGRVRQDRISTISEVLFTVPPLEIDF